LGYMVVPPALLRDFVAARYLADRQPATPYQTVVADFMTEGHFAAHIRRMRLMYRDQRDALVSALQRRVRDVLAPETPDQGMHLCAWLRHGGNDVALARQARDHGVVVRPLTPMYLKAPSRPGFLLGFTGYPRPLIAPAAAKLG